MNKKIESILDICCYLSNSKNDFKKTELGREYLNFKLNSMLTSKSQKEVKTSFFNSIVLLSL